MATGAREIVDEAFNRLTYEDHAFYWVKVNANDNWEPAQFLKIYGQFHFWGCDETGLVFEVGPRLTPPEE